MSGPYVDIDNGGNVAITPPTGKAVIIDGALKLSGAVRLNGADGAAPASALLMGVGTEADPALSAVADKKFIELRCKSSATSGDNRLLYMRFEMSGAGQSGEALRASTLLTGALGTSRGAQISLEVGATGYVTGLGAGVDAQLYIKNEAVHANGTYAALNVEIYSVGSSSSIAAVTEAAFIRIVNSGDATGMGTVDDKAFLFDLVGFASGAAKTWYDHAGSAPANVEEWVKCKTPGGTRWIPLYNAVA